MVDDSSSSKIDIGQSAEGIIGQTVIGATIVYGSVIYNNSPDEPDVGKDQTQAIQIGPNPYKGLLAFQETDGERFFGRDSQITKLWEQFRLLHEDESSNRVLTIYGPSGSGKSSLARAGLIPELAKRPLPGRDKARVAVLVPGSHPLEALATVLARIATNDSTPVAKIREFAAELKEANAEGTYDGLRRIADALPEIAISPLIVLVDQLEEVFTLCEDPVERDAFIRNLLCSAAEHSKRVSVILTLRSDFLGATQKHSLLNQLIECQGFFVAAMSEEGLREAIYKPAELTGHPLDQSTVSLLIEQTEGREGALPLLQFALTRIWAGLAEGKEPGETLKDIGGVGGALAGEAQRIYQTLKPEEQEIARRVFLGLVQLGEGAKDTRRRTELGQVVSHRDNREQVEKVIARFSDPGARLITLSGHAGVETAEVTHEALFDHWKQLESWLDGSRSDLRFQRRLDEAAILWQENGKPEGNLWRAPDLDLLRRFYESVGDNMTPLQLEFFQASVNAERAKQESIKKAAKEKKRQQQILAGVMSAGLVLTSGAAIFSLFQVQNAQRQRVEQLAINAKALAANQPVEAMIYAIAAKGLSESAFIQFPNYPKFASVEDSLLHTVQANWEQMILLQKDWASSITISPDGQRIVSGNSDRTIRLWDAKTGKPIGEPLTGHKDQVTSVAYSPDGQRIVSGSWDKTIRLWDAKTGKPIGEPLTGHKDQVTSVAYSPDGQRIVSGSWDKTIRLWDAKTGKPIGEPLTGHGDKVQSVAYSPDGQRIVSGSWDKTIRLWDAKTGKPIGEPLTGHKDQVTSVAYSPDGQRIVSGSEDKTIRLWDAKTGKPIGEPLTGHGGPVFSVTYSPDGQRIVSGSVDKTIRLWNANTGEHLGNPLTGHDNSVLSLAFSPDGQRIVSGSVDRTIRLWEVKIGPPIGKPLARNNFGVQSVAYSPDGQRIVSGGADKTIRLWDAKTRKPIGEPLTGHINTVYSVAYSPDGQRIVSGSEDKTIRLWDAKTGKPIGESLTGHTRAVGSVVFSPDSQRIVSGSADKTIRLWDAKTGKPIGEPLIGHTRTVVSVAYSPDGQRIVSGSADKTIRLWDAKTGKPIGEPLTGHNENVYSVAYSPDGQRIVSGSWDKTLRLWNAKTQKIIGNPLKGHLDRVSSVAYSPDGQHIVSGSLDKSVRLWDAMTGEPIGNPFTGHEHWILSVAFSPDGQHFISGSLDKTIRIWNISVQASLIKLACNQLRYHPSLKQPSKDNDIAIEAKRTCEKYVWKN
ncbi:WD40 repeat domain-containing protein [Acaryochloris marina]|uniref:WD40 repeat domain-containing protein n=1 Tax=Acaryochloris marina TaxID=155978 RepID=UPI0021C350A7|nr:WD40 repeat domain-containing protein [Acaryochloris marina]BDM83557.1 hypothetical protein AM10699_64180 [Acaryochloris marina MBIC10699]